MNQKQLQKELRLQTRAALRDLEGKVSSKLPGKILEPGVLVAIGSSFADVEWLIVRADRAQQRYWMVPVDTQSLIGSKDLAIGAEASGGPLSVRCGFGKWVPEDFLRDEQVSGRLSTVDLQRVLRRIEKLRTGRITSSMIEQETDRSASYKEWLREAIEPSVDALPESPGSQETGNQESSSAGSLWISRHLGLAATLVLVAGLSFLGGLHWPSESTPGQLDPNEIQRTSGISEEDLKAVEERYQLEFAELRVEKEEAIANQREEIARLQEALATSGREEDQKTLLTDPPFAILSPRSAVRGTANNTTANNIEIDADARSLILVLSVNEEATDYEVVIRDDQGNPVWQAPVKKRGRWEMLVQFPIPPDASGVYDCQLFGQRDGQRVLLHTYSFTLASPEEPSALPSEAPS